MAYRDRITTNSKTLEQLLDHKKGISIDSANKYIFGLVQTSTPDLQQEAANFYLNSNYNNSNLELKNEFLTLKTYFQEFIEVSKGASFRKERDFFGYLWDKVDFPNFKIMDLSALNSLHFKNTIWILSSDELEINRMFNLSFTKLKNIQSYVENLLKSST